jgi:hypothetical protein
MDGGNNDAGAAFHCNFSPHRGWEFQFLNELLVAAVNQLPILTIVLCTILELSDDVRGADFGAPTIQQGLCAVTSCEHSREALRLEAIHMDWMKI